MGSQGPQSGDGDANDGAQGETATLSPTSPAWARYYEAAARRRGGHGHVDGRRLRDQRKRRKQLERWGIVASLVGVMLLAWIFDRLLSR
jgi:hypothetical protein